MTIDAKIPTEGDDWLLSVYYCQDDGVVAARVDRLRDVSADREPKG